MPKPKAKSKPRKKAVKKTAAKKNASRAIKLQRGGMSPEAPYRGPTRNPNPRSRRRGVPTGSRRSPPTHEQGLEMSRSWDFEIADAFGLPGSRAAELRRRKERADLPPGYQRGGSFTGPANPRTNVPGERPNIPGQDMARIRAAYERAIATRRPPPPIRPGYQGGGELVDPNPFPFPGRILLPPGGWRPRRPNVPLPPGARRRRGRGRGGRDV